MFFCFFFQSIELYKNEEIEYQLAAKQECFVWKAEEMFFHEINLICLMRFLLLRTEIEFFFTFLHYKGGEILSMHFEKKRNFFSQSYVLYDRLKHAKFHFKLFVYILRLSTFWLSFQIEFETVKNSEFYEMFCL